MGDVDDRIESDVEARIENLERELSKLKIDMGAIGTMTISMMITTSRLPVLFAGRKYDEAQIKTSELFDKIEEMLTLLEENAKNGR